MAPSKITLHSITQAGVIKGQQDHLALSLQLINGLSFKKWFTGIGVGVDDYQYRSIPLFLDVRRNLQWGRTGFFVYADGGISFPWAVKKEEQASIYVFKRGLYSDIGIGHTFKINRTNAIILSGGYSIKKLIKERTNFYYLNGNKILERPELYYYELKRVLFKIGFQF